MVNPGAFKGSRKEFLLSEKPYYQAALEEGLGAEAIVHIQRRYFKRYPIDLPHDEEPADDILAGVDDDAPDPDFDKAFESLLEEEDDESRKKKLRDRQQLVEYRKAQIKRWMTYQYMKDHDQDPKDSNGNSPFAALIFKMTGKDPHRPRLKTAVNLWRKTQRIPIDNKVKIQASKDGTPKAGLAALRDKVAREVFATLPEEEKKEWKRRAEEEHEQAMEAWKRTVEGGVSESPVDRQRCIQGFVRLMQPLMEEVSRHTGWKGTMVFGGPEPAHGGRLNCISIHAGTTGGDVKLNFGQMERLRYKKYILPIFGDFLKMCYTPEECRASVLDPKTSLLAVDKFETNEEDENIHVIDSLDPAPPVPMPATKRVVSDSVSSGSTGCDPNGGMPSEPPRIPPASRKSAANQLEDEGVRRSHSPGHEDGGHPTTPDSRIRQGTPILSPPDDEEVAMFLLNELLDPTAMDIDCEIQSPPQSPPGSRAQSPSLLETTSASKEPTEVPNTNQTKTAPHGRATRASKLHSPGVLDDREAAVDEGRLGAAEKRKRGEDVEELRAGALNDDSEGAGGTKSSKRRRKSSAGSSTVQEKASRSSSLTTFAASTGSRRSGARPALINGQLRSPKITVVTPTPAPPVEIPADAPEWFKTLHAMLLSEDLGKQWLHLVDLWAHFEINCGYKEKESGQKKLPTTNRPKAVGEWMQRHRSPTWKPSIPDPPFFAQQFRLWWSCMQPNWRREDSGDTLKKACAGDWSSLERSGKNGVVNVLVALFFLGGAIFPSDGNVECLETWLEFVDDCRSVFSFLSAD